MEFPFIKEISICKDAPPYQEENDSYPGDDIEVSLYKQLLSAISFPHTFSSYLHNLPH